MHAKNQEENTGMQNADKSIKRGRGRHSWRGPIMKRAHNNITCMRRMLQTSEVHNRVTGLYRFHERVTGRSKARKRVTGMQRTMKYFWRILRIGLNYFGAISKCT
jgi:hypothetical protein